MWLYGLKLFFALQLECTPEAVKTSLRSSLMEGLSHASACTYEDKVPEAFKKWALNLLMENKTNIIAKARARVMDIDLARSSYELEFKKPATIARMVKSKHLDPPRESFSYFFHVLEIESKGKKEFILEGRHYPVFGEFMEVDLKNYPRKIDMKKGLPI